MVVIKRGHGHAPQCKMKLNSTNVRKTDTLATQAPNATEAMMAMQRAANAARVGTGV